MKNFRSTLRFSGQRWIAVALPYDPALGEEFKALVAIRAWDAATKSWWFPESYEPLVRQLLHSHDLCDDKYLTDFAVALARENAADSRTAQKRSSRDGSDLPAHLVEVRDFDGTTGQILNQRTGLPLAQNAGGGEIRFAGPPQGAPASIAGEEADPYHVLCVTRSAPMRLIEIVYRFWKREFDSGAPDTPLFRIQQAYERVMTEPEWGTER